MLMSKKQNQSSPTPAGASVNELLGDVTQALYHHSIRIRKVVSRDELERSVLALNQTVQDYLERKQALETPPASSEPVKPPPEEEEGITAQPTLRMVTPVTPAVLPGTIPLEETPFFKEQTRRMADIGTGLWRLRQRMIQPGTDQPLEEFRRTYRHVQSIWDVLLEAGYTIQDHTDQPFDIGMDLKVITYEQKDGIEREMISETIKPSIYYQREGKSWRLQMGEVIVATPSSEELLRP